MNEEQMRAEFENWWEDFKNTHEEWRFSVKTALMFQAWQAALASQANRELELIKTLQMLHDQRNCRYEIEAQFGTDIWQVLKRDNK